MFSSWPVCRLRRRREDRLRQLLATRPAPRAGGGRTPRRSRGSPSSRSRRGSRGRRTRSAASRAAGTRSSGRRRRSASRWFGHDPAVLREPEPREAGQHAALVGDLGRQHDVEGRDPVARDEQQALVVEGVDLAHLAAGDVAAASDMDGLLLRGEGCRRSKTASTWATVAVEVEDVVERRGVEPRRDLGGRRRRARGSRAPRPTPASRSAARGGTPRRGRAPTRRAPAAGGARRTRPCEASRFRSIRSG